MIDNDCEFCGHTDGPGDGTEVVSCLLIFGDWVRQWQLCGECASGIIQRLKIERADLCETDAAGTLEVRDRISRPRGCACDKKESSDA